VYATTSDGRTTIAVEDDGPGFERSLLDRPFLAFRRGRRSAYAGSGLGLSIVSAVADAHDGTVKAGNCPGGGARVTVVLSEPAPGICRARAETPEPY
jgi:signal transduction histidine kinase